MIEFLATEAKFLENWIKILHWNWLILNWLTIDFLTGLARFWWPRAHVGFDFWVTYYLIHSLKRFNNMDLIRCNLGFGLLVWVLGFIGLIQFQFQTHKLGLAQVRYFLFSTTATISKEMLRARALEIIIVHKIEVSEGVSIFIEKRKINILLPHRIRMVWYPPKFNLLE